MNGGFTLNQDFRAFLKKLDPVNTLFLAGTPILALVGTTYLIFIDGIRIPTLVLAFVMMILTGVGVTAGYHRLFAHKAYDANPLFKFLMLVFGAAAFENSARKWASDHRYHHKFVDTDQDPYNIKRGFFYAHMGWVCLKYTDTQVRYTNVPDLVSDKLVMWQEKYYVWIGVVAGYLIPMAIGALWGDALGALILAGFTRMVLNHHFTFCINSFCHMLGTQPYSDQNTARDSWFMALFTYGEGYHNFHHKFLSDYRNGIKNYHWDPTKWIIKAVSYLGLTLNLRQISDEKILLAKLRMDEKRIVRKLSAGEIRSPLISQELVVTARVKFEEAYLKFQALKVEYKRLKSEKLAALNVQISHFNERLEALKQEILKAREALLEAMAAWRELCHHIGIQPTQAAV